MLSFGEQNEKISAEFGTVKVGNYKACASPLLCWGLP